MTDEAFEAFWREARAAQLIFTDVKEEDCKSKVRINIEPRRTSSMEDWPEDAKTGMQCGWCVHYDPHGDTCDRYRPIARGPCKDFEDDKLEGKNARIRQDA